MAAILKEDAALLQQLLNVGDIESNRSFDTDRLTSYNPISRP
jgi:hypothetical protein